MPGYVTVEEFRALIGARRLGEHGPQDLAAGELAAFYQRWIDAGAAEIDSSARAGGYRTPIDVAAVAATDAVAGARLAALLANRNAQAALKSLRFPADNFPAAWADMITEVDAWLQKLGAPSVLDAGGEPTFEVFLPGLERAS